MALNVIDELNYVGPINPSVILWQKALSKFLRVAGVPGDFYFFSQQRLNAIAGDVHAGSRLNARLDFFHGFTPWILTAPARRYVAWSDCTFRDYINIFHKRDHFRQSDLDRIESAEAAWLKSAHGVLFPTRWAAERAIEAYGLDATHTESVGIFGELDEPAHDTYAGSKEFAFVATNFEAKGGHVVLSALQELRGRHPETTLTVIGEKPSNVSVPPGVEFFGFLRKEVPDEYEKYRQVLSRVRALVHPTKSDIAPLIIIEAGYFGCPVISSRRFAIPELVDDGRTGILLDDPSNVAMVTGAMNWMLENEDRYFQMRKAAWAKVRGEHSKAQFRERLCAVVRRALPE